MKGHHPGEGSDVRLARGVVRGIGGGGIAQAGAARRAGRDRLSAREGRRAPRARTTGPASAGRHRTHAVPGPASPAPLRGRGTCVRFAAPARTAQLLPVPGPWRGSDTGRVDASCPRDGAAPRPRTLDHHHRADARPRGDGEAHRGTATHGTRTVVPHRGRVPVVRAHAWMVGRKARGTRRTGCRLTRANAHVIPVNGA